MSPAHVQTERFAAPTMFVVSVLFLVCLAGALHLEKETDFPWAVDLCRYGLAVLYPAFVIELLWRVLSKGDRCRSYLLYCFLPPLRLGARDAQTGQMIWLPRLGWTKVDLRLRDRIEKAFSLPMIVIALMVLPLMMIEHFWSDRLETNVSLASLTHTATGLIWLAFTFEFIVMISIVDKKLRYCKEHWIDLAVILLPLIAFLRAARLGRLLRIQQLSRTARVYRLRGTLLKTYRALMLVDGIARLFRGSPARRLARLQERIAEKERELEALRCECRELEALLAPTAQVEECMRKAG
jgi:voltage-gated potassium channel